MRKFLPLAFATLLLFGSSAQMAAQNDFEDGFLPKYPTASERNFMEIKAAQMAEDLKNRGALSAAARNADSCADNCGVQAPGGCWCDELCAQYGDCCDDYADQCIAEPADVPEGLIVPGEFEESQSVILRWPYTSLTASRTRLYAELIDAIQQEVPAWIFVNNASDSTSVINALDYYGVDLEQYEFLVKSTNSIWARDYGPWGFYYGEDDELAFIDLQYYPSRPLDNQVPAWLADYMGVEVYSTNMYEEGGNLMVDGFGNAFHGTGLFSKNTSLNGWTTQTTRETHQQLFNTINATEAERLLCDGGTGHIDMYAKLLDEQTMIVSEYPAEVTASDKNQIEENVTLFEAQNNVYGGSYHIERLPMPLRNDGSYSTTCSQINSDARGFVNGLLVNKTFIVPIYSNENSPQTNRDWDEAALDKIRAVMPGYNVVGIDARSLTIAAGAIHCVAMQIPADNPLRFKHERLAGNQPALPAYSFSAEITNKSGIASASLFWKLKDAPSWNELTMSGTGSEFSAELVNPGFTVSDTVVYYVEAETNNGKISAKPYTAPEGYYTFFFDEDYDVSVDCPVPDGLYASNISNFGVTLNWTPVTEAESYTIQGTRVGSSSMQTVNVNNGNASSRTVNILDPGTDYQWQIRTNCSDGAHSDWSDLDFFTSTCLAPTGLNVSNISATSATLSWSSVTSSSGYQLRGRPVGGNGYAFFEISEGTTAQNTGNQLDPLTDYEWSVRAYCDPTKSTTTPWSLVNTFTTSGSAFVASDDGELKLSLFPNPTEGAFLAAVSGASDGFVITVRDITGREVFSKNYPGSNEGGTLEIDLGRPASGIYMVQLTGDTRQTTQKLVIR